MTQQFHFYPKQPKGLSRKDICTNIFIAILFTIAKNWKQPMSTNKGLSRETTATTNSMYYTCSYMYTCSYALHIAIEKKQYHAIFHYMGGTR